MKIIIMLLLIFVTKNSFSEGPFANKFDNSPKLDRLAIPAILASDSTEKRLQLIEKLKLNPNPSERELFLLAHLHAAKTETLDLAKVYLNKLQVLMLKNGKTEEYLNYLGQEATLSMRKGETQNCIKNHNAKSCLLPLRGKAIHVEQSGSRNAIKLWKKYLEKRPEDLHAKWLLNLCYMTLGEYPQKVPSRFLLKSDKFSEIKKATQFVNIAGSIGLENQRFHSGGAVIEDFNNDGLNDVLISSSSYKDSLHLFINQGTNGFKDATKDFSLEEHKQVFNISVVDFNNDGLTDLYLHRGAWHRESSPIKVSNTLLMNVEGRKFQDITEGSGHGIKDNTNMVAIWADYNNDGFTDLFVCNEVRGPDLYKNIKGKLVNAIEESQIINSETCKGASWGDFNNDGFEDLFISNYNGSKNLWINQKNGTFKKSEVSVKDPLYSHSSCVFDYDNDGNLDIFISEFDTTLSKWVEDFFYNKTSSDYQRLYRNLGEAKFEDVTKAVGLDHKRITMGINIGDVNNDGYIDIYLGTGTVSFGDLMPNSLFVNHNARSFKDETFDYGLGTLQKGHGISFGDLNNDGDQELFSSIGGAIPADDFYPHLFSRQIPSKSNWVNLKLEGEKSNKMGIGVRVKANVTENGINRDINFTQNNGCSFGSKGSQVHLGVGEALKINRLEIKWPASGIVQSFHDVKVNQFYKVNELKNELQNVNVKSFPFDIKKEFKHSHF